MAAAHPRKKAASARAGTERERTRPRRDHDGAADLCERLIAAVAAREPLEFRGGGSKAFYGRAPSGTPLEVAGHRGIVDYRPSELMLRVRCGTPLAEVEQILASERQCLPFEPPDFNGRATIGGAVASGLSGPRRPWGGAVRDLVLGTRIINGLGQDLRFGGEVMKNVAGYDISRLMVGAMGSLGLLLDVSLKVNPQAQRTETRMLEESPVSALERLAALGRRPLPLTGAALVDARLYLRFAGNADAVAAACAEIGGEEGDDSFWRDLRDHRLPFFGSADQGAPLWRLSLPPTTPVDALAEGLPGLREPDSRQLIDWGGAQRWLHYAGDADRLRAVAVRCGGHALCFRGGDRRGQIFHPLAAANERLHRSVKEAFDPYGLCNPGRLYADL